MAVNSDELLYRRGMEVIILAYGLIHVASANVIAPALSEREQHSLCVDRGGHVAGAVLGSQVWVNAVPMLVPRPTASSLKRQEAVVSHCGVVCLAVYTGF